MNKSLEGNSLRLQTSFKQKVLLILFGLFCFIVLFEIVLRLGGFVYNARQEAQNKVELTSSEIRILCIGESTTALGGTDSYPSQLQEILQQRFPSQKIKVINRGRISKDSWYLLNNLEHDLDRYKPHIVVGMIGINDTSLTPTFLKRTSFLDFLKSLRVVHFFSLLKQHLKHKSVEVFFDKALIQDKGAEGRSLVPKQNVIDSNDILTNESDYYQMVEWLNQLDNQIIILAQFQKKASPEEQINIDAKGKEIQSNRVVALRYIAAYHHTREEDQMALVALSKASALASKDVGVLYEMARVLRSLGKYSQGLNYILQANALLPNNQIIVMEIGRLFELIGNKEEAYKVFQKVMELEGDNPWLYKEVGQWFWKNGYLSDAEAAFNIAIKYPLMDINTFENLIQLVEARGEQAKEKVLKKE
ncbi:MAG: hypothetical protein WCH62_05390, partial [Candidatus Omnitrophota bacterium]